MTCSKGKIVEYRNSHFNSEILHQKKSKAVHCTIKAIYMKIMIEFLFIIRIGLNINESRIHNADIIDMIFQSLLVHLETC